MILPFARLNIHLKSKTDFTLAIKFKIFLSNFFQKVLTIQFLRGIIYK